MNPDATASDPSLVHQLRTDLEEAYRKDSLKTKEYNILVQENRALQKEVERLKVIIRDTVLVLDPLTRSVSPSVLTLRDVVFTLKSVTA